MEALAKKEGFQVRIVPAETNAQGVLDQLGPGVEAVYLMPALRLPAAEWQALIDGLNARKIPSFSMLGVVDVERGVLAGLLPDIHDLVARRVALNIQQIVRGTAPADLPVALAADEKLTINARTAVKIDFKCAIEFLLKAHVLFEDALETGAELTLEQAMRLAMEGNVNIAIKRAETQTAREEKRKVASQFLPQVSGNAQYQQLNANQSEMSGGLIPEKQTTAGVGLSQLIFSDQAFSQYRAAHRQVERMRYEEQANRLEVIAAGGARFLQFLAAKALRRIEAENLRLTRSNLELARVRFQAGAASPEEVFRWEAQEARQRSSVIAAESKVESARVALNQSMGLDQESQWKTRDIPLAEDDYYFLGDALRRRLANDKDLVIFEKFAVRRALENSPALLALDQAIAIQGLELGVLERRGYMPVLTGSFDYNNVLNDEYAGPSIQDQFKAAGVPLVLETDRDRNEWTATIQASVPLFEGGGRLADVARAKSQLRQLRETRRRAAQWIEQETRTVLYALQSSHPNIGLSRTAADRAHKNLDVVRKKYAQGAVSILDLLDAQNQVLTQDQAAAIAVYTYLQDLVQFQRAISWFEWMQADPAKKEFVVGLESFWQPSGGVTNRP
jgi:outer membrane protein TolC